MVNNDSQSSYKHTIADDEDIVLEILARLPVKSLMRFQSVCKQWCGLISQSHFIKKHISYADNSITSKNNISRLIFSTNPPTFIRLEDLEGFRDGLVTPTRLDLPATTSNFEVWDMKMVGSCHGLICLEINLSLILIWNPYTGESVLSLKPRNNCVSIFYGFGYDSNMEDYKVVLVDSPLIQCEHSSTFLANHTIVMVFALKAYAWNSYEWSGATDTYKGKGYLLNGALHWLEFESSEFGGGSRIVSFHLNEEKFEEIPLPFDDEVTREGPGGFDGFMTFVDRLCVYSGAFHPSKFSIRMLEEYEVKDPWVQIFLNLDLEVVPELVKIYFT